MAPKASDITSLVELFAGSGWDELHVEIDGLHLFLSTDPNARLASGSASLAAAPATSGYATIAPRAPAAEQPAATAPAAAPAHWVAVRAPNLGTFYQSPKPGAAPFVTIGQSVTQDSEVCLLEVMKLFTTVKAGTTGVVRQVCVQDAAMVEHGTVLFYIEPA